MWGMPISYSVRSLLQRRGRSALTMLGVAVAVFVSVMMIGLSRGLMASTRGAASPNNVVVLSVGAESMEFSAIEPSDFQRFRSHPDIAVVDGQPLSSPEVYLGSFISLPASTVPGDTQYRGIVRGVWPEAYLVHGQFRLVEGALPTQGHEVIVGRLAATKLGVPDAALSIGRTIEFEGETWRISGRFEAPGSPLESEIWADLDVVMAASRRNDYSLVTLKTHSPAAAEDLVFDLNTRTDVRMASMTEISYYEAEAARLRPITIVSMAVTVMLVLAATLAAMNTMFTSILGRAREMAILVVRGYRRRAVLAAFLVESVALCLAGGLLGGLLALLLNDMPMRVPMGAFRFAIGLATLGTGLLLATLIGVLGALFPLFHVARRPVVEALGFE